MSLHRFSAFNCCHIYLNGQPKLPPIPIFLSMPKISECDRCHYFLNSPYLVCGVNPSGPEGSTCEDFRAITPDGGGTEAAKPPLGGGYYAGDWIPQPFPALTAAEELALLDWHPQFSGRYPNCEIPIEESSEGQWECEHCDWKDDEMQPD
jgi:hypothetical protein